MEPEIPPLSLRDQLLLVAEAYVSAGGAKTLSAVASRVFNDGKSFDRLSSGGDLTTSNFERAMSWFSTHWPASHDWPAGIARPAVFAAVDGVE